MASDETIFKFKGGYIPLEDLEDLNARGVIHLDDQIYIADHQDAYFLRFDLKTLKELYGRDQPFRRRQLTDEQKRNVDNREETPSDEPSVSEDRSSDDQPSSSQVVNDQDFVYVDYPLFHIAKGANGIIITGEEVFKQMARLKKMLSLKNWGDSEKSKFFWLNRKNERVAICRLCGYTPFGSLLFFRHLFSENHCKKLSKCLVPLNDFIFWKNKIRGTPEPGEEQMDESSSEQINIGTKTPPSNEREMGRIPLLACAQVPHNSVLLSDDQLDLLAELFTKMDVKYFGNTGSYFVRFLKSIRKPNFCYICHAHLQNTPCKIAKHILKQPHLDALKSVKCSWDEYNIWVNLMRIQLRAKNTPTATITRILEKRNSPTISLIDFKLESDIIEEQFRKEKLEKLRKLWARVPMNEFNTRRPYKSFDENPDATCYACDLPKGCFPDRAALIEHMLTEKHMKFLLEFGFSEKAYMSVMSRFQTCIDVASKHSAKQLRRQENRKLRKENDDSEAGSEEVLRANCSRVPLLDLLSPNTQLISQKVYVTTLKQIEKGMKECGEQLETELMKKTVNWQCAYCSTKTKQVNLNNELEAIRHILHQKHKEKMKFQSSSQDLVFWTDWAARHRCSASIGKTVIHPNRIVPQVPDLSEQVDPEDQLSVDASKQAAPKKCPPNGDLRNDPRVALLDSPPPGHTMLDQADFNQRFNSLQSRFAEGGKVLKDFAKTLSINWVCAFCKKYGQEIVVKNHTEALTHIISKEHRRQMGSSSDEDMNYWKDWIEESIRQSKIDMVLKTEKIRRSQTNDPRVPLLDVPRLEHAVLNQRHCTAKFYIMKENFKKLDPSALQQKMAVSKCFHCPDAKEMSTVREVLQHVLDGKHIKNIMYIMTFTDFTYWEKIIAAAGNATPSIPEPIISHPLIPQPVLQESSSSSATKEIPCSSVPARVPLPPKGTAPAALVSQKQTSESSHQPPTDPLQRPVSPAPAAPIPQTCRHPLFVSSRRSFEIQCVGPTVAQLRIILLRGTENLLMQRALTGVFFEQPTACDVCNVSMTRWSLSRVIDHAFSVQHLRKSYAAGMSISPNDYGYWIETMQSSLKDASPEGSVHVNVKEMNGQKCGDDSPLTAQEMQLLREFNANKLDQPNKNKLLQEHGVCHTCNVWIPWAEKIVPHFLSMDHNIKTYKFYRQVPRRIDVAPFLEYAKASTPKMCLVM